MVYLVLIFFSRSGAGFRSENPCVQYGESTSVFFSPYFLFSLFFFFNFLLFFLAFEFFCVLKIVILFYLFTCFSLYFLLDVS